MRRLAGSGFNLGTDHSFVPAGTLKFFGSVPTTKVVGYGLSSLPGLNRREIGIDHEEFT